MLSIENKVRQVPVGDRGAVPDGVLTATEPVLLKGLVAHWPVVAAGLRSAPAAVDYLRGFYRDATVGAWFGSPEIGGRFFYNDDMTGFNYKPVMTKLDVVLEKLLEHLHDARPPAFYVGSTTIDTCLPGFRAENDLDLGGIGPLASIWLGNKARIAAHYDLPDNLACTVVGRRRFTLFPPGQLENLYVGPLDFTPAGQSISLVDFEQPDLERFPRFSVALQNAQVAELEPGDAIFIPSMWWHHVEALDGFNVLVNYWWRQSPAYMGVPINVLMHALLGIRDLPEAQRRAWQEIFRHYVFEADDDSFAHIPERSRGVLSPIDDARARGLRALLLNALNR
jgi:hypothetical protein